MVHRYLFAYMVATPPNFQALDREGDAGAGPPGHLDGAASGIFLPAIPIAAW